MNCVHIFLSLIFKSESFYISLVETHFVARAPKLATDPNGILRNFPLKSEMKILLQKAKQRNGVSELIAMISC